MPTLENRVAALEARSPGDDEIEPILITFATRRDGRACDVEPVAIKEMLGPWRLAREDGEELEVFRERALSLCPRTPGRPQALIEEAAA